MPSHEVYMLSLKMASRGDFLTSTAFKLCGSTMSAMNTKTNPNMNGFDDDNTLYLLVLAFRNARRQWQMGPRSLSRANTRS